MIVLSPISELIALARTIMPNGDDSNRVVAAVVALILVGTWSILTISLSVESIGAISPPYYGLFTAVVFLLVGRLWGLEVKELLGNGK